MLYDYINIQISFIIMIVLLVLGDWNDDLKDKPKEHCFDLLFYNDDNFYFTNFRVLYMILIKQLIQKSRM